MSITVGPRGAEQTIPLREPNSDKGEQKSPKEATANAVFSLIAVQDQERRRIARDLHDSMGQTVALLKMNLDRLAELAKLSPRKQRLYPGV